MVEVESGVVCTADDEGVVCVVGAADVVVSRMDDDTAELIDESMDEVSTELVVAGALVVVGAAAVVVDMMEELLAEGETEVVDELAGGVTVNVTATPARAKD